MSQTPTKISIFGLGYVGSVTAACLASRGHEVTGIDVQSGKVDRICSGKAPISEPGLDTLIHEQVAAGRLKATSDPTAAVSSDISLICVGTPSTASGELDLGFVESVCRQIVDMLKWSDKNHCLVFRSTMLPGSTRQLAETHFKPFIENKTLSIYFLPEFLRQGTAIADFRDPGLSCIGVVDLENEGEINTPVASILDENTEVVELETAELLKYSCNAFHATKVNFANEIGRIAKAFSADGSRVMELLCSDHRLNISSYYMRPGNPFGGSCLPKDVSALTHFARSLNVNVPTLDSILRSNRGHLQHLIKLVEQTGQKSVVLVGLAFKNNTDDLRGSSLVDLAKILILKDYQLTIYDPLVSPESLVGMNKRMASANLPSLASVLKPDLAAAIPKKGTLVVSKPCAKLDELRPLLSDEHHIIDVNGWRELEDLPGRYHGICW
jgi:GDP-mannose 6-dehydrogenase